MHWINTIALRYFFSRKKDKFVNLTSKIAIFSISFGISMLIVAFSVIRGFEETIFDKVLKDQGHIIIYGNGAYDPANVMKHIPKELKCIPLVETHAMIVIGSRVETALIRGVDANTLKNLNSTQSKLEKNVNTEIPKDQVLEKNVLSKVYVGNKFAKILNLKVKDSISLIVPINSVAPFEIMPETLNFEVHDIVKFNLHDLNRYGIFIDIRDAQNAMNLKNKVHKIICFAENAHEALKYIEPLQKKLPNYYVYSWQNLNMLFADIMRIQRNMVSVILFAIIFLATIASAISLILFIHMKKREISILIMLGATRRNIISIFTRIGLIISILSSFFGVIFGIMLALNLDYIRRGVEYIFNKSFFDPDVYLLPAIPVSLHLADILIILGVGFCVSFFAALFPAFKASNVDVLENLQ